MKTKTQLNAGISPRPVPVPKWFLIGIRPSGA